MAKPKVAIFDFACCEGCQLQVVNMEEALLDLLNVVDVVEWREAMSEQSEVFDIALIEGSITRPQDEEKLQRIRKKAAILVSLGACAVSGGVLALKNRLTNEDAGRTVYGDQFRMPHLQTEIVKAVKDVVKVDYEIRGCPIDRKEFAYIVKCLALGREPFIPSYPVCVECRIRENACLWEKNQICLGPLSRAGCDANCPTQGAPCVGCRGFSEDSNPAAMSSILELYGKKPEDLESRLALFLKTTKEPAHA
jgi:coenzyme F420-reducing hydrogenase gamma subunit